MINFADSGGNVDLPNPVLGDSEQHNIFTKYQISMGKTVYSTKDTSPRSTLVLQFRGVKTLYFDLFTTWYLASRGKVITYTDYNSKAWTGIIKNDPMEISVTGRKICPDGIGPILRREVVSFTVQFEAEHT